MDNKEKIITIAQNMIQTSGLDSFSFRTLAEKVNIKSSSVHYYFPKKEDLVLEISKKYQADFLVALDSIQNSNISPQSKILELVSVFELARKEGKMCFYGVLASSYEQIDQRCVHQSKSFFNLLEGWVKSILVEAKKNNKIEVKMTPEKLAKSIIGLLEGSLMIDRLNMNEGFLNSTKSLIKVLIK